MAANSSTRILWEGPSNKSWLLVLPIGLLGSGLIGFLMLRLQEQNATLPLLMLCGLCIGVLTVVRPEIGLATTLICAAAVKITIGTGTDSVIVTSLVSACLLVAGWLVHQILHKNTVNRLPAWIAVSVMSLCGFTLFSWLWGRLTLDPRISIPHNFYRVQIAQAAIIFISVALLFVGADLLRNRRSRTFVMAAIIGIGLIALPFRAFAPDYDVVNTGGLFGIWFVSCCWANATLNHRLPVAPRILFGIVAFGWLAMAILREGFWVSGWLPVFVAMLFVSFMAGPRIAVPFVAVSLIVVVLSFAFIVQLLITTQVQDGSLGGEFGRLELWKRNVTLFQDRLVLGSGPAGYALYYMTFLPDRAMSTHNNYVDIMAQTGVAGLSSFVALLAGLFVYGRKTWTALTDPVDRTLCAAVLGALPALTLSLWFGDWLLPFVYNVTIVGFNHSVYSWLMLAALCGLIAQTRERGGDHA